MQMWFTVSLLHSYVLLPFQKNLHTIHPPIENNHEGTYILKYNI